MPWMRWEIVAAALVIGSLPVFHTTPAAAQPAAEQSKPNVVFIIADDLGWTDLACYGSKYYETPSLDRLAAEGVKFTSGYTSGPNCTPTRAALMTGQYGPRTGVYTVGNIKRFNWQSRPLEPVQNVSNLPLDRKTVANLMKDAGYATGMYGKWHLGNDGAHHPSKRGFEEAIVAQGKHFDFETDPKVDYPKGQYLADFITEHAVGFIEKNKDRPFFLYVPHFGVHGPHQAKPELIKRFKDKAGSGGHDNPTYAAMIYSVDESVGRIMDALEQHGLSDNTLVVFTSDNGGVGGYRAAGLKETEGITNNAPLRGGKGMLYEGGVRVPLIARWPGKIQPGSETDEPVISVDLFPTLLAMVGAERPSKKEQPLDGVNIAPILHGDADGRLEREALFWHFPGGLGARGDDWRTLPVGSIRSGDYKLMEFFEDGRLELYNLKQDIGETNNLAEKDPDRAKALHTKLVEWRKSVGAKMPQPNTNRQPANEKQRKRQKRETDEE